MYQDTETFDNQTCQIIPFPVALTESSKASVDDYKTSTEKNQHFSFAAKAKKNPKEICKQPDNFRVGDKVRLLTSNRVGWIFGVRTNFGSNRQNCYFIQTINGGPRVLAYSEFLEPVEERI